MRVAEGVVRRTHGGPLHTVMKHEQANVGLSPAPLRFLQHVRESLTNPAPDVGESCDGNPKAPKVEDNGLGPPKDVDVRVDG